MYRRHRIPPPWLMCPSFAWHFSIAIKIPFMEVELKDKVRESKWLVVPEKATANVNNQ